jgi:hypothetical protein
MNMSYGHYKDQKAAEREQRELELLEAARKARELNEGKSDEK